MFCVLFWFINTIQFSLHAPLCGRRRPWNIRSLPLCYLLSRFLRDASRLRKCFLSICYYSYIYLFLGGRIEEIVRRQKSRQDGCRWQKEDNQVDGREHCHHQSKRLGDASPVWNGKTLTFCFSFFVFSHLFQHTKGKPPAVELGRESLARMGTMLDSSVGDSLTKIHKKLDYLV